MSKNMNHDYIDPRLIDMYKEYVAKDKEYEFINMLYAMLDLVNVEIRQRVYRARAAWKRRLTAEHRKMIREKLDDFFAKLTPEELIHFQNTPWNELPEWIRAELSGLVQFPEQCNFIRIFGIRSKNDRQQETVGSRIIRIMNKRGLITRENGKTVYHYDKLAEICNATAKDFDLSWAPGKKAQRTRITAHDLKNYTQCRITPKIDKTAVLTVATDLPAWYVCGYGDAKEPPVTNNEPLKPFSPFTDKFRKTRA